MSQFGQLEQEKYLNQKDLFKTISHIKKVLKKYLKKIVLQFFMVVQ